MDVINPTTGEVTRTVDEHSSEEVDRRLQAAQEAYAFWRRTSFPERATLVKKASAILKQQKEEYARLMTEEMGKTISAAVAEIDKCAWVCDYFADHAQAFLSDRSIGTGAAASFIRYDSLGAILAIMPWNFPFWQVFRFAAPVLMAGNVGLLKHAPNVPGCAMAIEQVFGQAGFPEGVFASLLVPTSEVPALIAHPAIQAVTLTGSVRAGQAVAAEAGRQLKKTVLELGGSDPFIVLGDAEPLEAAAAAARARTINCGQSCIAAKRLIVEESVVENFQEELVKQMRGLKVGDPMDPETEIGPMAREDLLTNLHDQVERSIQAGAKLLLGGCRLKKRGYFYPPTVLSQVRPGMAVFDEETFGPVAAIIQARDAKDAVDLANRSNFGLGASIWTSRPEVGQALASEIEAGLVFVNEIVQSDPRLPFGGIKRSGYGRELSDLGILEFVNIKTVWVA
jgi:succinate-semialdehyde dehydrogenase / glutarate-semialdehyde dehydrogenase